MCNKISKFLVTDLGLANGWRAEGSGALLFNNQYQSQSQLNQAVSDGYLTKEEGRYVHVAGIMYDWQAC